MEKQAKLHSKGGRLYVVPSEVIFSEKGKDIIETLKNSKTYKRLVYEKKKRYKEVGKA